MALAPGSRIGSYEIAALIGAGGMGEVYRATDASLHRQVAIKVLPEALATDTERLARFDREARTLAALNHPHIAALYGLERSEGANALVMELVEGPTLADRVREGPVPMDETLRIARQIAEALEAAHERGIVHRDLKPANVKVRPDGVVKVLDFGLARVLDAAPAGDASESPTLTAMASRAGVLIGTAAYMSPEQARGKPVDRRADIWAFGCVLYEMLAGRRAFEAREVSDTLAKIIEREPDYERLPATTPDSVRTLLRRCLAKDSRHRLADIADARLEIDEALASPASPPVALASEPRWPAVIPWAGGIIVGGLVALLVTWLLWAPRVVPVRRLSIPVPPEASYVAAAGLAVSPDGTQVVYVASAGGARQLYLRPLGRRDPRPVPGTEGALHPFFSPDGAWVAFFTDGPEGSLKKVSLDDGELITLCLVAVPGGGTYLSDDTIVFASAVADSVTAWGLYRVPASGGQPQSLTTPDAEANEPRDLRHGWPAALPDGQGVLFSVSADPFGDADFSEAHIALWTPETGTYRTVIDDGFNARYVPSGHIVYVRDGTLMAVSFDVRRLDTTGDPFPLPEAIQTRISNGAASVAVSSNGTLAYVSGRDVGALPHARVVWVDRDGREEPVIDEPVEAPRYLRLSPDETKLALGIGPDNASEIWIYDLRDRRPVQMTRGGHSVDPAWSPDSQRIAFASNRDGVFILFTMRADDSTREPEVLSGSSGGQSVGDWLPDGQTLLYWASSGTGSGIHAVSIDDGESRVLLDTPFSETAPRLSPDGSWLAYRSNASGRQDIWARPFPDLDGPVLISSSGGTQPMWARDGTFLYYLSFGGSGRLMGVPVNDRDPARPFGEPRVVLDVPVDGYPTGQGFYDVGSDGRFLVLRLVAESQPAATSHIELVESWFEELERLAPAS